jgi:small subunit ribosomal protein S8
LLRQSALQNLKYANIIVVIFVVAHEVISGNLECVGFALDKKLVLGFFLELQNPAGSELNKRLEEIRRAIMSMSDPIADMLTRIRNAILRQHSDVCIPHSKIKENIAKVLLDEGFISGFRTEKKEVGADLTVDLKYDRTGDSVIRKIDRESKPGLRIHKGFEALKPVLNGQGIYIISTSHGVVSDSFCRSNKVGGEILCKVY